MFPKTKAYIILSLFFGILVSCLLLLSIFPHSILVHATNIFKRTQINCIFLVICSLALALALTQIIDLCYWKFLEIRWRRSKLGDILVKEGHITEEELKEALSEQGAKLGEILVSSGLITFAQLDNALNIQKKAPKRLGEILTEFDHITDEDIQWALEKRKKKLGEILLKKGLITDYDLNSSLSLQHYGPRYIKRD